MSFEYCGPKSPLGEKINCITLTKDFFEKHNINSVKENLIRNLSEKLAEDVLISVTAF